MGLTTSILLSAALHRDWRALSVDTGLSVPRLIQMALRLIDDPDVIAEYPVECAQLRSRRDRGRVIRAGVGWTPAP